MEIKIETSDGYKTEVDISELNLHERSALAGLLGMKSRKAEIFNLFRGLDQFKKIKSQDVFDICPHKKRFPVELVVSRAPEEVADEALEILQQIDPDASFMIKRHVMGGFCKTCNKRHEVVRDSALVFLEYQGLTYTKRFEV